MRAEEGLRALEPRPRRGERARAAEHVGGDRAGDRRRRRGDDDVDDVAVPVGREGGRDDEHRLARDDEAAGGFEEHEGDHDPEPIVRDEVRHS